VKIANPLIIAYTDNGKYYCDGVGSGSLCINKDLEQLEYEQLG